MFARLNDDWYLNLDRVHEAVFARRDGVLTRRVTSLELTDEGQLMTWMVDGEEAENLRAALLHCSAPRTQKGVAL